MSDPEQLRSARRCGRCWSVVGALAAAVALALAFAGWKVWDGLYVRASEARNAVVGLPYDFRFRRVPTPDGLSAVIAGQGRARDGTTLNFAILIGGAGTHTAQLTVVPGAGRESVIRVGNATVITSAPTVRSRRRENVETDMTLAIEDAVFDREPLRPRDG
jgi:hypothetical protein